MTPLEIAKRRIGSWSTSLTPTAFILHTLLESKVRLPRLPALLDSPCALFRALSPCLETWFNCTTDSTWIPAPGDIVFLANESSSRFTGVGFVEKIDLGNFVMWLILAGEGGFIDRCGLRLSDSQIVAFVRP